MKNSYNGTVSKIRYISEFPNRLVRFTLITKNENINCIATNDIADKLMLMIDDQYHISVFGHPNKRNQLVVEKMFVKNPNSFIVEFSKHIEK